MTLRPPRRGSRGLGRVTALLSTCALAALPVSCFLGGLTASTASRSGEGRCLRQGVQLYAGPTNLGVPPPESKLKNTALNDPKAIQAVENQDLVEKSLESATPVPQDFAQAVTWASLAAIKAWEAGKTLQSMYFKTGEAEMGVSGELGNVLQFAEQLSRVLATSKMTSDGGVVRTVFIDMGSCAFAQSKWEDLPETLKLDYLPPMVRDRQPSVMEQMQLDQLADSKVLVVVAPTQNELPAVFGLVEDLQKKKSNLPIIFVNPKLMTNMERGAGTTLTAFKELYRGIVPTFHLEQIEPAEGSDLAAAVVTRVWPRPFSVWEDAPDDPEQIDGYFLLDLNDKMAQETESVESLLKTSRDAREQFMKKLRTKPAQRPKGSEPGSGR